MEIVGSRRVVVLLEQKRNRDHNSHDPDQQADSRKQQFVQEPGIPFYIFHKRINGIINVRHNESPILD